MLHRLSFCSRGCDCYKSPTKLFCNSHSINPISSFSFILHLKENEFVAKKKLSVTIIVKGNNTKESRSKRKVYVVCIFMLLYNDAGSMVFYIITFLLATFIPTHVHHRQQHQSLSISSSFIDSLNINHHLSFVHYNVQSLASKLNVLNAELFHFDIFGFY